MSDDAVRVVTRCDEGLATIELCGPRGNALDSDMLDAVVGAVEAAAEDDTIRGVLLTSAGRIFCPGLDLRTLPDLDRDALRGVMRRFGDALYALYSLPKPLVVAISGHALAGGCMVALAGDWRVIATSAHIGMSAMSLGVPLPYAVVQLLREVLTAPVAAPLVLEGRVYEADSALADGLVHEALDKADVLARAQQKLAALANAEPAAYALTKSALRHTVLERVRTEDGASLEAFLDCWFAPKTRARLLGVAARLQGKAE